MQRIQNLSDRFNLPDMIPYKYPRSGTFKIKAAPYEEFPSLTFPSNHLSTSPHSQDSIENAHPRQAYLTSGDDPNTSSTASQQTEIKISFYNKLYILEASEGERCVAKLQDMLEKWEVSEQTKVCIKLIVVKKIMEINTKYVVLFNETVREYEDYMKSCI